jgi:membrane AbrB-like protein
MVAETGRPSRTLDAASRAKPSLYRRLTDPRVLAVLALTYAIASLAGYAATLVRMPLPWMLGPFFVCGALTLIGFRLGVVPGGREIGQVTVGFSVGMKFTADVLLATAVLLPAMILATLYVVACTTIAALLLRRLAGVDETTAFFATSAGGVADMSVVAEARGGEPASVAIVHALRMSMTVAVVPFLIVGLGEQGTAVDHLPSASDNPLRLMLALGLALLFARLLKATPLPNPWMVGAILFGLALALTGHLLVRVPAIVIVIAQILMGAWLGCQFKREIFAALPRVAMSGFITSLMLIALAGLGAFVLARTTGLPITTSFLALAPAGITEMVITAKVMHLEAEYVTAFHVMRIAVVSTTVLGVFWLYQRLERMIAGSRP